MGRELWKVLESLERVEHTMIANGHGKEVDKVHELCSSGYPGNVAEVGNQFLSFREIRTA